MIFAVRCLAVSLTFFLISYSVISVAVACGWRIVRRAAGRLSSRGFADLLFAVRSLPVAVALMITLVLVLPSFLLLEPPSAPEPLGEIPLILAFGCLLLLALGAHNGFTAWRKTERSVKQWLENATAMPARGAVPVFRIQPEIPALTLAGLCAPRVLVSDAAATLLVQRELEIALRHEMAHARSADNLKKLWSHFWVFPGMFELEEAWNAAQEMAADDAAVSSSSDALDLASALIKLSRLAPIQSDAALTSALVQKPATLVNARVERLVAWGDANAKESSRAVPWYLRSLVLGAASSLLLTYGFALHGIHALTELLVR
jgi:Zn-dependent protease with chaperone function